MLRLFDKAPEPYEDYIIASIGMKNRTEAYEKIEEQFEGLETQVFHNEGEWYIIMKQ